jgi:hypothetical protein
MPISAGSVILRPFGCGMTDVTDTPPSAARLSSGIRLVKPDRLLILTEQGWIAASADITIINDSIGRMRQALRQWLLAALPDAGIPPSTPERTSHVPRLLQPLRHDRLHR